MGSGINMLWNLNGDKFYVIKSRLLPLLHSFVSKQILASKSCLCVMIPVHSLHHGLTSIEAADRLQAHGPNELSRDRQRGVVDIVRDVLQEPMFLLLLVAGGIYLLLGDTTEALMLVLFASLSVSIAIIQAVRSEKVLANLKTLTSPRALVIRDGQRIRIPGREVVPGDLLVLQEGDRVPADALVRDAHNLFTDESLLTGEAVPVRKTVAVDPVMPRPGGDNLGAVFSGTLVVSGWGVAEVMATGTASEIGRIGHDLGRIDTEPPRLRAQTSQLVCWCAFGGGVVSIAVVLLYGVLRGDWLEAILGGIALSMSLMPEEFPLVLSVFMVMGAWRIAKVQVLTRRATAIEMLGAATVLCTDKTGTLTQNKMTVMELWTSDARWGGGTECLNGDLKMLAHMAALASAIQPHDPMEMALHAVYGQALDGNLIQEYPLQPGLSAMTQVWQLPSVPLLTLACKGAPEVVLRLCRLSEADISIIQTQVADMATKGLRVLAVATGEWPDEGSLPKEQAHLPLCFLGLVGLADPLRPEVPTAIAECRAAGIKVAVITGDYAVTAAAIAAQAGIEANAVLTGTDIATMNDKALTEAVQTTRVFARILPEQKLRIVTAFKTNGDVVAMTGDGVNDAPALKAAHIGIAMGQRGTDVAREAAALVLLRDDFGSIVHTIRLGRRIYDNLRKTMGYIIAVHIPIAGMALLPLPTGWPLLFLPLHIALLELIIDPVCSLVFEAEDVEGNSMLRPPRPADEPLLPIYAIILYLLQGVVAFGGVTLLVAWGFHSGLSEAMVRGLALTGMVAVNIALVLVNRSFGVVVRRPGIILAIILAAIGGMVAVLLTLPALQQLLRMETPPIQFLGGAAIMASIVLLGLTAMKGILKTPLLKCMRAGAARS